MKKIAFMSTGCQSTFGKIREIIAADPKLTEVNEPEKADVLLVNFCAISTESFDKFNEMKGKILKIKRRHPFVKVMAGGCIEGLEKKYDLSFVDVKFRHKEEVQAFSRLMQLENYSFAPFIHEAAVVILIQQGCARKCTFCKVHYLDHMGLMSRPLEEIMELVDQAVEQGVHVVCLNGENTTEYGLDIGTNIRELLRKLTQHEGVRFIDVQGICADEVDEELLELLEGPKIRQVQIEAQSLNDMIRRNMGLLKTKDDILAIFERLKSKPITSNMMVGFPGHSYKEFQREMKLVQRHHLYFLTYDPYDDSEMVPSHKLYTPLTQEDQQYYFRTFVDTIVEERKLLIEELVALDSIEATIMREKDGVFALMPTNYVVEVRVRNPGDDTYKIGDVVRVKITGVDDTLTQRFRKEVLSGHERDPRAKGLEQTMEQMMYFNLFHYTQQLPVKGRIISSSF